MSASPVPDSVRGLFSKKLESELLALRQTLHRHPELSLQETRTQSVLREHIADFNPQPVAKTGLIARIPGKNPDAPLVAIRGDIDALPIHEETGLPYASENDGVMHACGHDVHATWAVGAAKLLAESPAEGDVLLVLQPAEEVGKGARMILDEGALEGVSAIFGGHVDRRFAVGEVVADIGPLAASADSFEITLTGAGAHGARPHESKDPVMGLAALIQAVQTIVSRKLNPATPGVVTIGKVTAGSAPNVIPESVYMAGTVRATDAETRALLNSEVERMADAVANLHGLKSSFQLLNGCPPIVNPEQTATWAQTAVKTVLGDEALTPLGFYNMGGEDFSFYMEAMPGCFMRIGAREEGGEPIPAHSPSFYAADGCIFTGAAVLAECARTASSALAKG